MMTCPPFLGQLGLESFGVKAHADRGAGEPLMSDIGGLLPIALKLGVSRPSIYRLLG